MALSGTCDSISTTSCKRTRSSLKVSSGARHRRSVAPSNGRLTPRTGRVQPRRSRGRTWRGGTLTASLARSGPTNRRPHERSRSGDGEDGDRDDLSA
jgi:hypothetical protein